MIPTIYYGLYKGSGATSSIINTVKSQSRGGRWNGASAKKEGWNQHPCRISRTGTSHSVLLVFSMWQRGGGAPAESQGKARAVDLLTIGQELGGKKQRSWDTFGSLFLIAP